MKIIEATAKDIPKLIELNDDAQKHHVSLEPKKYKQTDGSELTCWLEKLLNDQSVKVLIATINALPIGYAITKMVKRKEDEFQYSQRFMLIDHISILKKYRNKGYGKKLVEEIKKYTKQLNIDTVSLFVLAKNSSAVKAYKKMGFETEGLKMTINLNEHWNISHKDAKAQRE